MKTFITLLLGCSLALVTGLRAEQPENLVKKQKKAPPVQKQQVVPKQQHNIPGPHVQPTKQYKSPALQNNAKIYNNGPKHQPNNAPYVKPNNTPYVKSNDTPYVKPNKFTVKPNQPVIDPKPVMPSNKFHVNKNVKNFQPRHQNFHAQVKPSVASVQFNQNFRIRNAQNWKGNHYTAFKNYHPQWHDKGWWHTHHNHVVLIGGGWYFWNAGYWYPAWGYDNSAAYYPYDGPIYVGDSPRPFDQIVADVQSVLQEQGYYRGEVDGLVGPLTQEALAAYQSNAGLEQTAAIDQPTLESLGIS